MDVFRLQGSLYTQPTTGSPSGDPEVETPIMEQMALRNKTIGQYNLDTNDPVAVSLAGLEGANVVMVKSVGGRVRVRITSADGVEQAVPVDSFMVFTTLTQAITAIDLTRQPGVSTNVRVFLGERA